MTLNVKKKKKKVLNDSIEWAPTILGAEGDCALRENFQCDQVIKNHSEVTGRLGEGRQTQAAQPVTALENLALVRTTSQP